MPAVRPVLLQAFRDNHRISLEDPDFAQQLWERCGLRDVCSRLAYEGRTACGLNPNLRFYRYAPYTTVVSPPLPPALKNASWKTALL